MSTLRSALDELRSEDLRSLPFIAVADRLDEIERAARVLEAERGRGLAELERRGVHAADGHLSVAAWLAHRQGLSRRSAESAVRRARALEAMPGVARAFGEGEISESAVHVLASAQEAATDAFADSEPALVEAARSMAFGELRRVVENWRITADPECALEEEDQRHERRHLDLSPTPEGMTRGQGELDAEDGQGFITAVRAQMDAESRSAAGVDARTPAQRRADALGEICRQWLASSKRPTVGGERPHVVVTIDLESLVERSGRPAELQDTGAITGEAARRLACDANVTRVITRGRLGAIGARPAHEGRSAGTPKGRRGQGRRVPLPRLRSSVRLVRRPPRSSLGGRRRDVLLQPDPAVPAAPPSDSLWLRRRDWRTVGRSSLGRTARCWRSEPRRPDDGEPGRSRGPANAARSTLSADADRRLDRDAELRARERARPARSGDRAQGRPVPPLRSRRPARAL